MSGCFLLLPVLRTMFDARTAMIASDGLPSAFQLASNTFANIAAFIAALSALLYTQ